jgi:hypothetical protein
MKLAFHFPLWFSLPSHSSWSRYFDNCQVINFTGGTHLYTKPNYMHDFKTPRLIKSIETISLWSWGRSHSHRVMMEMMWKFSEHFDSSYSERRWLVCERKERSKYEQLFPLFQRDWSCFILKESRRETSPRCSIARILVRCVPSAKSHRLKAEAGVSGEQNFDSHFLYNETIATLSHNLVRSDVHSTLELFRESPLVPK